MKKLLGFALLIGFILGADTLMFAQQGEGQGPPRMEGRGDRFERKGGPGGKRGERGMRGKRGKRGGERGPGGGMRGGFGIGDHELFKLNLTNDQKVKLFDFRKKMMTERETAMKQMRGNRPEGAPNPQEMRQLMSAKMLGTLTPEQKTKLDGIEAQRKQMMDKRKTEMEARKAKMEATHQEFLNIFTLEQRKQIEQGRAERMKQMQERRPGGPGGPGGPGMKRPEGQPKKPV